MYPKSSVAAYVSTCTPRSFLCFGPTTLKRGKALRVYRMLFVAGRGRVFGGSNLEAELIAPDGRICGESPPVEELFEPHQPD